MTKKCYLSPTIADKLGYTFTRVVICVQRQPALCDSLGMAFPTEDEMFNQYRGDINGQYNYDANQRAKKLGYRKYTGKKFGGCFVGTSYNLDERRFATHH